MPAAAQCLGGRDFVARRDTAIIRLFLDTGVRLAELTGLAVSDVDLDADVIVVLGKGRRPRACPFGARTGQSLDRYLRMRARHARAAEPALWLAEKNRPPLTIYGVGQMLHRRGDLAGIPASTRTSCGTPSPASGWPLAGPRAT